MKSPIVQADDSETLLPDCKASLCFGWPFAIIAILVSGAVAFMAVPQLSVGDDGASKSKVVGADQQSSDVSESEKPEQEYVRVRRNVRKLSVALETSVIHFADSKTYPGATVDLIGAIHLGEPEYYQQLNELFRTYDALLFEAVMPEEAVKRGLRPGGGSGSHRRGIADEQQWTEAKVGLAAISVLQLGMKDALGVEFQLAGVDYTADNFVHADMTSEEFEACMAERGESFSKMFVKEIGKSVANQQESNPLAINLDVMLSMLASDRVYRVRRIAAVQLAKASDGDAFAGFDGTSTIITERNKKCLKVMQQQLKTGEKKIGIFYGAGHFSDMEKRMVAEYGFERKSEDWLIAWHLRSPEESTQKKPKDAK